MGSAESDLASNHVRTATSMPDRPALKVGGQDITYQQLHGLAAKLAGSLRAHGIEPGDRVALILPNVPVFPVAFYATLLAGGVVGDHGALGARLDAHMETGQEARHAG